MSLDYNAVASGPAIFSRDRRYRYLLTRTWDVDKPRVAFIGLNPSTADEQRLDPTLKRCVGFADAWGYGRMNMLNLFALRSTDPVAMKQHLSPVGADNDKMIKMIVKTADLVVACWGAHGRHQAREAEVRLMLDRIMVPLYVFGLNRDGTPMHPLYLPATLAPEPWT